MSLRKRGEIESIKLEDVLGEDFAGVVVRVKHIGHTAFRRWALEAQRVNLREADRVRKLRSENPDLPEGHQTVEYLEESIDYSREVLRQCVVGIEGLDIDGESDPEALVDELDRIGATEALVSHAMRVQQVTRKVQFPVAGDGNVGSESAPGPSV